MVWKLEVQDEMAHLFSFLVRLFLLHYRMEHRILVGGHGWHGPQESWRIRARLPFIGIAFKGI